MNTKVINFDRDRSIFERWDTGSFYTPLEVVNIQMEYLRRELGEDFEDRYYFWDPACGTGNLFYYFKNVKNVFLSTIDLREIEVIVSNKYLNEATIFQYDYLNDDIEYLINNEDLLSDRWKLPQKLRGVLKNEPERLIILMNPPFTLSTGGTIFRDGYHISKITFTKLCRCYKKRYRGLTNLGHQFLFRSMIHKPWKIFSYGFLTFINGDYSIFRNEEMVELYESDVCFVIPGKLFSSIYEKMPIYFMKFMMRRYTVDETPMKNRELINFDVYDCEMNIIKKKVMKRGMIYGKKINNFFLEDTSLPKVNILPVSGPLKPIREGKVSRCRELVANYIGYLLTAGSNIFDSRSMVSIFSTGYTSANGKAITPNNFERAMIVMAVRRTVAQFAQWYDDRDCLYSPSCDINDMDEEFISDCVVVSLFDNQNYSSLMKNIEWRGKIWNIQNEFYPFLREEFINDMGDETLREEVQSAEETFVAKWLRDHTLTNEAKDVLFVGREIYRLYYKKLLYLDKMKWRLDGWNVGWYQIRQALKQSFPKETKKILKEFKKNQNMLQKKILEWIYKYEFVTSKIG